LEQYLKHIFSIIVVCLLATFTVPFLTAQSLYADETSSAVKSLFIIDTKDDEFLSPDVAFQLYLGTKNSQNLTAIFKIAPGYYLYKQRIKFAIKDAASGKIEAIDLPVGDIKDDPNFGKQEVYHHDFTANIKLASANNPTKNISLQATYQGCSEKGLCYAPITQAINVALNDTALHASADAAYKASSNEDKTTLALKSGNLWLVIAGFFIAGLLLSFTPCVLPMIPILSSIIVGCQSKHKQPTKIHAFGLSVAYVLGMALSYTLAGIAAGLSGNLLSQSLQNPWVLGAMALLFVMLAFSMFGFYELKLPFFIEHKILNISNKLKSGESLGVFIMGVLSALIVSPCVAAPLAGALIYIGKTHNVLLGGVGLFTLAIGMGMPLLLIGASAGSLIPKAGSWMTIVRNFFGVLMLMMAVYIVWPVLPNNISLSINRALGLQATYRLPFQRVHSVMELDAAIKNANGKMVMLDFYADWCTSCKEMEKLTFSDEKVRAALKDAVLLQTDVTENNDNDQALLKHFGLFGPPGIIFFDKAGNETTTRVIGYKDAAEFAQIINKVNQ